MRPSHIISFFVLAFFSLSLAAQTPCVNFKSSTATADLNERVTFIKVVQKECSSCGEGYSAKSYSWTFEGARSVSKSGPGPHNVTYVEVGTFGVKLTVSYFGADPEKKACIKSETKAAYITVSATNPVELESFEANPQKKQIKLYWTVIHEKGNDHFLIEKSNDKETFVSVSKISSSGNHSSKTIYSTLDKDPSKGKTYYRLSSVNKAGEASILSELIVKWFDINTALNVAKGEDVLVIVADENGNEVYSKVIITDSTDKEIYAIDPSNKLKPGSYVIIGSSNNEIYNKTLIVEAGD